MCSSEEQEAEQAINKTESLRRISTSLAVIGEAFAWVFLATAPAFGLTGLLLGTRAVAWHHSCAGVPCSGSTGRCRPARADRHPQGRRDQNF